MPTNPQPIAISWRGGKRNVMAIIVGPLAVHHGPDHKDWTVSHVVTGYRVIGRIKTRARAIRVAKSLQHLDWNFRSPKSRKVKAMASKVAWVVNLVT